MNCANYSQVREKFKNKVYLIAHRNLQQCINLYLTPISTKELSQYRY